MRSRPNTKYSLLSEADSFVDRVVSAIACFQFGIDGLISKDSTSSPQQPLKSRHSAEAAIDEQLERDANEMAEEAQKVQKRNEEDRGIFTK